MEKTLEQRTKEAHDAWLSCWEDITSITMDWQDCRLLIHYFEQYAELLNQADKKLGNQEINIENKPPIETDEIEISEQVESINIEEEPELN